MDIYEEGEWISMDSRWRRICRNGSYTYIGLLPDCGYVVGEFTHGKPLVVANGLGDEHIVSTKKM